MRSLHNTVPCVAHVLPSDPSSPSSLYSSYLPASHSSHSSSTASALHERHSVTGRQRAWSSVSLRVYGPAEVGRKNRPPLSFLQTPPPQAKSRIWNEGRMRTPLRPRNNNYRRGSRVRLSAQSAWRTSLKEIGCESFRAITSSTSTRSTNGSCTRRNWCVAPRACRVQQLLSSYRVLPSVLSARRT